MTREHWQQIEDAKTVFPKLVQFIRWLLIVNIPLDCIDTNDWGCNTMPGVYVHNKKRQFRMQRYCRCAESDVPKALAFYNKQGDLSGAHTCA